CSCVSPAIPRAHARCAGTLANAALRYLEPAHTSRSAEVAFACSGALTFEAAIEPEMPELLLGTIPLTQLCGRTVFEEGSPPKRTRQVRRGGECRIRFGRGAVW